MAFTPEQYYGFMQEVDYILDVGPSHPKYDLAVRLKWLDPAAGADYSEDEFARQLWGVGRSFRTQDAASEAAGMGGFEPQPLWNGLPWLGGFSDDEYNRRFDENFIYPNWRIYEDDQGVHRSMFDNSDSALRRQRIIQSLSRPQGPTDPGKAYTRADLNMPSRGELVRRRDKKFQLRDKLGKFTSMVAKDELELQNLVRGMLVQNYKSLGIGEESGMLMRSLLDAEVSVSRTDESGFCLEITPKEHHRPARTNEPAPVSTNLYGNSIRYGHRGIIPVKQRFLRFKSGGEWITTRNVRPVAGKDYMKLSESQISDVVQKIGQQVAQALDS